MKSLKIEITKTTELSGTIYYRLYFNDKYETLSSDQTEIQMKADLASKIFLSGENEPVSIFLNELTKV